MYLKGCQYHIELKVVSAMYIERCTGTVSYFLAGRDIHVVVLLIGVWARSLLFGANVHLAQHVLLAFTMSLYLLHRALPYSGGHLERSRLIRWWRKTPYMLNNSDRFIATFIELVQDRNWKVICNWLSTEQSNCKLLLLDRSRQTVLHHAILYRAPAHVVDAILRRAPSLASVQNDLGEVPLHWAIRLGVNREIMNLLLRANPGAGVYSRDYNGITPLWLLWDRKTRSMSTEDILDMFNKSAASWKRVEMLLDPPNGIYRSKLTSSLLHKVAGYPTPRGIFTVVYERFRQYEQHRDSLGRTPLHIACSSPEANVCYDMSAKVQFLLEKCPGAHRTRSDDGRLPLHNACLNSISLDTGLSDLLELDRGEAFCSLDPVLHLPLFALPAAGSKRGSCESVNTSFVLLMQDPAQLLLRGRRVKNN